MIVGVGRAPRKLLEELRKLIDDPRIFIFPEFFDDKKSLVQRRYVKYVESVYRLRDRVVIAPWPDYLYDDRFKLCDLDVIWVFPLHSLSELDRVPSCVDVVGFCGDPNYRDYNVRQFVSAAKAYGYKMWFLGASRREIAIATSLGFWGLDVNTGSTGLPFRVIGSKDFPKIFAQFLKRIANNEYKVRVLLEWI